MDEPVRNTSSEFRGWFNRFRVFLLGEAPAHVPPRVAERFQAQQRQSEILIGWTQAVGIAVFAIFYALSPSEISVEMPMQPVPIGFSFYAVFVALRLFLAYRGRLSPLMIGLSILVDIGLLLGIIATLPLMYNAPAALYLKHTSQVYLFVIIALRALRFEPGWVLFATGAAALGWLGMILYAATADGAGSVTFDPLRYFTEPVILPAAEVDHIAALLAFGAVLALTVARGRNLVLTSVSSSLATRELSQFFAPKLAERITSAETPVEPGTAELRDAAIVFFDIRDFSPLAQRLSPQDVVQLLGDYHRLVVPIVDEHGGSVDKFLGDGVLVSFGAIEPSETYAADALRAARAVIEAAGPWNQARAASGAPALRLGAAVTSGTLLLGAVGHGDRLEYTVLGEAVNLAAKLEDHNRAEGVSALTTVATLDLARAQGFEAELEIRSDRAVAGVDGRLDLAVLVP